MTFKFEIANPKTGKTYHFELSEESAKEKFFGKKIGDKFEGSILDSKFSGYEFEITGLSDKQGFPALPNLKGTARKRVLLSYGIGMRQKRPKGLRKKKTVRGNTIAADIVQINVKVVKQGSKDLDEIFGKKQSTEQQAEQATQQEAAQQQATEQTEKQEKNS